jgi:hypothetical protein
MASVVRASFWAVPDASSRRWCDAQITALADRADSRGFAAHLTLVGEACGGWTNEDVAAALRGAGPVHVELTEVDDEDATYRCVTLRAAPAGPTELRRRLLTVVEDRGAGTFRPHLSVLYGALDPERRRALVREVALRTPLPPVVVDAVAAWDTSDDDWSRWHEVARWPLEGTPT